METAAHDAGDAKMTASKEELHGIGGFLKKIWKHNLFNEVYRQKEITKARTAIKESGNVYIGEGGDAKHHAAANQAIVERFVSEYDETLHKEAGEKRETLGNTETEKTIQKKIRDLVVDYATSKETPNDEVFQAEKIRIFNELKGVKKDIIEKGDLYADNVLEIAKQIRQNIDHNKGCADLDIDFEVVVGKAKSGARTEAQFSAVDRITEKIHKSPVGRFVNEATITSAVAIAYNLGIAASQRIASSKLAAWGTFGATAVLGGGIAAARESRKLEIERKQHFREMAQGKTFDPSKSERRTEMETSRYETRDAVSLILGLEQTLYTIDKNGNQTLNNLDQAGIETALKQLAEIESRIKLSDTQKIDLISYSDVKNIESERLALDLTRAKAKEDLHKLTKNNSSDTILADLQKDKIKELTSGEQGIERKNALFKGLKKKKVAMAAFKGIATGLIVGAAAQEIVSFLNDQQHGLIEGLVNPGSKAVGADPQHLTSLEFVRRYFSEDLPPGGGSGATVSPKEFLASHPDGMEKIRRVLWYDNDTPKPIFDKNELKLWWGGKQGTGIDTNGNYVFNMKHMLPNGSYHKTFSADAQDLMQSGKLKMLFSLSRDTQNQVFEIPIDAKGNAIIDPHSEIGKMLFANKGGHAEFLGKYAEVAQTMGSKDGAEQVRILATHVGKGVSQVELPSAPYIIDQPIIPVFGRTPLEKTREIHPYLDGYFADDKKNREHYQKRRSPRLVENPNVELNHYQEIDAYLSKQTGGWKSNLESLSKQMETPMDEKCRIAVCIPAAGHQEGKNIFHTLEQYKNQKNKDGQPIDPRLFEIDVFVNYPEDKKPDETKEEIKRFQKENPEMHIQMTYKALPRSEAQIGTIRKYVTDLALLRHHKRGEKTEDLIIVSNDADCSELSPEYISTFLEKFETNKKVDAFMGKIDWEKEAYIKSPLIHIGTRFFQYLDVTYRHHKDKIRRSIGSSGANFAMKSSMYAAVGGYDENDTIAEDRHLGSMIKSARQGASTYPIEYAGTKSYIYTNARRVVNALKQGLSPAEQWGTDFGPDDILRETQWTVDGTVNLNSSEYQEKLRAGIERFINRTIRVYRLSPTSWETKKALRFLGVKYKIEKSAGEDTVVISDVSKLITGLKNYQKRNI